MDLEQIDPAELVEWHRIIKERLGIDATDDPDPLISLPDVAELAGLAPGTPGQMRQRSRKGQAVHPFPEPAPGLGQRFADKPLWHAATQIIPYLKQTGNWPPEAGARKATRGPRKRKDAA